MKAYEVTMQSGVSFAYITDELQDNIPAAIFERFQSWPAQVVAL